MGADIYLEWANMTKKEKDARITGFDVTCGKYGYLRGSYGGHIGFDAIEQLFEGVDWDKKWKVDIKLLKKNLKKLEIGLFKTDKDKFYSNEKGDLEIQSYRDFVKLAETKVKEGKNPWVYFSY